MIDYKIDKVMHRVGEKDVFQTLPVENYSRDKKKFKKL